MSTLPTTAVAAIAAIRAGELAPAELWAACHAAAADERLNALTWLADVDAGPAAELATRPLGGVPLGVKDLFCLDGVPSQAGSRLLEGYRPPYTATVVQQLIDAGAAVLAKTNQDEFAMGSSNENSAFGPVLNPLDHTRVPGGSSGGSAAAVAAGLLPWALGTDTGGSIRQPAALCGIVGLKPTYGACSRYGLIAFASSLDQAGPMARSVADVALLFSHMAGQDRCDATSVAHPGPLTADPLERLDGLRIGVPAELTGDGLDPDVRAAFQASLTTAEGLGATVEACSLPHAPYALSAYYLIAPAECSSNLARYDGVRYGLRATVDDVPQGRALEDMSARTRSAGFGPEVKRRILLGTYALSSGYYDAYYRRAQQVRTLVARDFDAAFAQVDLIATPTSPTVAFELGARTGDPLAMYLSDALTVPMSLAGVPAVSIPNGRSGTLPTSLQLTGPAFSEASLLAAAAALEAAHAGRPPALPCAWAEAG